MSSSVPKQSPYFTVAKDEATITFLHHHMLECDLSGQDYTIEDHDITLRIPEGAVAEGEKVHLEVGVAMYGPFIFPENTQPISPILWLCLLEEGVQLKKPFQVILPHYLTGLNREKIQYHQIGFAKANHYSIHVIESQINYEFVRCITSPVFGSSAHKNYGVLVSRHCCFYCLLANHTPELAKDTGYCLVRVEHSPMPQRDEVYFAAIYFLDTCLRVCSDLSSDQC